MSEAWQMKAPTERLAQAVEDQGGRSIERVLGQRVTFTTHPNPQIKSSCPKAPRSLLFQEAPPLPSGPSSISAQPASTYSFEDKHKARLLTGSGP